MEFLADQDGVMYEEAYRAAPVADPIGTAAAAASPGRGVAAKQSEAASAVTLHRGSAFPKRQLGMERSHPAQPRAKEFVCSPPEIGFSDFEVGQSYTIDLSVTNVSAGFATFRMQAIPPKNRDAFTIKYDLPPRIPAGLSWPVSVIFTPTKNEDISEVIEMRTETGALGIPLKATKRRSQIRVLTTQVDFGRIAIGESQTAYIVLENTGALGDTVTFTGTFAAVLRETHTNPFSQATSPFLKVDPSETALYVHPHSQRKVIVTFSPYRECELNCTLVVVHPETEKGREPLQSSVIIRGQSTGLPVYVANPDIDFMWCFFGRSYSHPVRIANTSTVSTQVVAKMPSCALGTIRCDPEMMTVQAGSTYEATLHFTPTSELPTEFESVIEFQVKGQGLPTAARIRARVTAHEFTPSMDSLSYGTFFVNEERMLPLSVRNDCLIPQKVWFADHPSEVRVKPPTSVLLPGENFAFSVFFRAVSVGPFASTLTVCGQYGLRKTVKVTGASVSPAVLLSESSVKLPLCPIDGQASATIVATNASAHTRDFEFVSPTNLIKVSPSTGVLKPGESLPLGILLSPQPSYNMRRVKEPVVVEAPKPTKHKSIAKASAVVEDDIHRMRLAEEERKAPDFTGWDESTSENKMKTWRTSVLLKCTSRGDEGEESVDLAVCCTVAEPSIVMRTLAFADGPSAPEETSASSRKRSLRGKKESAPVEAPHLAATQPSPFGSKLTLDFGDLAIGTSTKKMFLIYNKGSLITTLGFASPWHSNTFRIVKPCYGELEAGEEDAMTVEFAPKEFGSFSEVLRICTSDNDLLIRLVGRCSETDVSLSLMNDAPADLGTAPAVEEIRFEPTVSGGRCEVSAVLTNAGAFPVRATISFIEPANSGLCPSTQPFVCNRTVFDIPPKGKTLAHFCFRPLQAGSYVSSARIDAGNFSHTVRLVALCVPQPVYVILPGAQSSVDYENGVRISPILPPCAGISQDYPVQLRFQRGETKEFTVGGTKDCPPFECVVDQWKGTFSQAGWEISALKVPVSAGGVSQIAITLREVPTMSAELVPYCRFNLVFRCAADPTNDRTMHISCTGP